MAAAAAAPVAEVALADSFAMAAPEMFVATESFVPAVGTLGELGAMEGMGALGSGLGGAGLFGEFGGSLAGQALGGAPSVAEAVTTGITSGGAGAGGAGINEALINAQQTQALNSGFTQAELQAMQRGQEIAQASSAAPPLEQTAGYGLKSSMMNAAPTTTGGAYELTGIGPNIPNPAYQFSSPVTESLKIGSGATPAGGIDMGGAGGVSGSFPQAAPSGLQAGFQQALDFAKQNPLSAASMGYSAYKLLQKPPKEEEPEEYNGILTKYKMSPNFKGRQANPADFQYTPKMYAEGGIMQAYAGGGPVEMMSNANALGANTGYPMADINKGEYATPWQTPISRNVIADSADTGVNPMTGEMRFAKGGKTSSELAMDYYSRMTKRPEAPPDKSDMGIYYDLDPETRYLDPVTAAQIRQAKVNKRANVQMPGMKRPTPMGQINLAPPGMKAQDGGGMTEAAHGGIMSLGGYAAGGNPRLLKGPGDGMSDNIPATIANKQPARLADGEFVVPADVVSHLGNGSTDAGAKKLHQMMTNVRKARTGNPKQGKQIKAEKYIPT